MKRYNAVNSEVLYPPLGERVTYDPGTVGDTIVYVSRVVPHKRQLLAVEALALTRTPVKLTIAGRSEDGSGYAEEIYQTIARLGLMDRVSFVNTVVSDHTKRHLISNALGVAYIPLDEDSYGFVGLEAAAALKPIVTTTDSGGVVELVESGVNGIVAEPAPFRFGYSI